MPCNYFRFRLSPEVVIGAGALVKRSGEEMRGEPVELIARHQTQSDKSPYERLLGDAVRGDGSLFTQDDCRGGRLAGRRSRAAGPVAGRRSTIPAPGVRRRRTP